MDDLVFRKAHELAELLAKSVEMNEYDKAKTAIMNNPDAAMLWNDFQDTLEALKVVNDKDEHAKLLQSYQLLTAKIQNDQLFTEYFICEGNLNELISSVNFIINRSLFGEVKLAKTGRNCGGGCGGCSGCSKK